LTAASIKTCIVAPKYTRRKTTTAMCLPRLIGVVNVYEENDTMMKR